MRKVFLFLCLLLSGLAATAQTIDEDWYQWLDIYLPEYEAATYVGGVNYTFGWTGIDIFGELPTNQPPFFVSDRYGYSSGVIATYHVIYWGKAVAYAKRTYGAPYDSKVNEDGLPVLAWFGRRAYFSLSQSNNERGEQFIMITAGRISDL